MAHRASTSSEGQSAAGPSQVPGSVYNIVPSTRRELHLCRDSALRTCPELQAAIHAVEGAGTSLWGTLQSARLGRPGQQPPEDMQGRVVADDLFGALQFMFNFQEGNVANQREHLVLSLTNAQMRLDPLSDPLQQLGPMSVHSVFSPLLSNYLAWCQYLRVAPSIIPAGLGKETDEARQGHVQLCYCALFLLIWGEAANVRFMPECLCYIFHHVAEDLNHVLENTRHLAESRQTVFRIPRGTRFLDCVVAPFYNIARKEAPKPKVEEGKPHNSWRNYDDLNEFFWSKRAFDEISWPPRQSSRYFLGPGEAGMHVGKQGFVEQRTLLNLFSGFDRVFILLILALQVMIQTAWAAKGGAVAPWTALSSSQDASASLLSAFITWACLNLLVALVDMMLQWRRLRPSNFGFVVRITLRCVAAGAWIAALSIIYGMMWTQRDKDGAWSAQAQSLFRTMLYACAAFLLPQALALLFFLFPMFSRLIESSNFKPLRALASGMQEPQFVGRGMRESLYDSIKYALFWLLVLAAKFAFSYKFQVVPLVNPTNILLTGQFTFQLPVFFKSYEYVAVACIWVPAVIVYLLDLLIWYSVFSAVVGYLVGVMAHIGEINNLKILVLRFRFLPRALRICLLPATRNPKKTGALGSFLAGEAGSGLSRFLERMGMQYGYLDPKQQEGSDKQWVIPWNEMIRSFREEDLLHNSELELLSVPSPADTVSEHSVWPAVLLSGQVTKAVSICKRWRSGSSRALWRRLSDNEFRRSVILESYDLLCLLLRGLVREGRPERRMLEAMITQVDEAAATASGEHGPRGEQREFCAAGDFNIHLGPEKLVQAAAALAKFLSGAVSPDNELHANNAVQLMQGLHEVLVHDVWGRDTLLLLQREGFVESSPASPLFVGAVTLPRPAAAPRFYAAARRLHIVLSAGHDLSTVPRNPSARRRITFFCNSVFMRMPAAVPVRQMRPFCVLTPYFKETVEYSAKELRAENEDGVSTLVYLQSIYPDEWRNLEERIGRTGSEVWEVDGGRAVMQWASFRGQTLSRTVRGMMYYSRALEVLAALEQEQGPAPAAAAAEGGEEMQPVPGRVSGWEGEGADYGQSEDGAARNLHSGEFRRLPVDKRDALRSLAHMKFTYVVSCQVFGDQQRNDTPEAQGIVRLMRDNPALRIAYVDTVNAVNAAPRVFSVLVKWDPTLPARAGGHEAGGVREVFRVELPGPILIGEGKPENQNHAIIFTRGQALQAIDMNQDSYLEEALKIRNFLEEFGGPWRPTLSASAWRAMRTQDPAWMEGPQGRRRRILGMREHVFTGAVSSLASFMSAQETAFVTLGQRVLANPLKVRMHYGHPDVFDRTWTIVRGGVSKASKTVHVSEDIFAGFNTTLRGGGISHHEYMQVGKGRDVGLNQISLFEAKVASGNGEQVLSRDVFRLGRGLDAFRSLSFYTTSVGFFFATALTALSSFAFLYGRVFLALSGIETSVGISSWGQALLASINQQFLVQLGILTAVPMLAELFLEKGLGEALWEFALMLLQLGPVFFSFSMGTRSHYFFRSIMHGGAKYRSTGRGFVVRHESFLKNFRLYSRSHFNKGLELALLLIIYMLYSGIPANSTSYWLLALTSWILALAWLLSPFLFNPMGFDWLKCVDDWDEWVAWMWRQCEPNASDESLAWEAWWSEERRHLRYTGPWGLAYEFVLSLRWFFFQYALVYQLRYTGGNTSILVYVYSWVALVIVMLVLGAQAYLYSRFSLEKSFTFRSIQVIALLVVTAAVICFFTFTPFTIGDVIMLPLVYLPTGWGLLQWAIIVAAAVPTVENAWAWSHLVVPVARVYDLLFGAAVFLPFAVLSWLPGLQDMQTRVLFNQGFSRNLQISRILGDKESTK